MRQGGTAVGVAGVAALVTGRVAAPPARASVRHDVPAAVTGPARCRCGHDAAAHEHFRPGTDCGSCGAQRCGRYHAPRRTWAWLRRA